MSALPDSGEDELREAVDKIVVSMIRTFTPDNLLIPLAEGESYTSYDRDSAVNAILALIAASNQRAVQKAQVDTENHYLQLFLAFQENALLSHYTEFADLVSHSKERLADLAAAQPRKDGDE